MSTTEASSNYQNLDQMTAQEILVNMNKEDAKVHQAVAKAIPAIEQLVEQTVKRMKNGGRLFYIGAGTSGRLGVLDASEIPPTYGVEGVVIGLIAGGDRAIRKAVEAAEDNETQAWEDLKAYEINANDVLVGIAASGRTPYVLGGLAQAKAHGLLTAGITCNAGSKLSEAADIAIEAVVGPEFVTGSTRMKAGTAQKLVLNMISTACMIRMGKVKGNRMVDMQLTNEKLVDRGAKMIVEATGLPYSQAEALLLREGSVRKAVAHHFEAQK